MPFALREVVVMLPAHVGPEKMPLATTIFVPTSVSGMATYLATFAEQQWAAALFRNWLRSLSEAQCALSHSELSLT